MMAEPALPRSSGVPYHWLAFATVAVGTFMGTMDASITNIMLPNLSKAFDAPPEVVLWVTLAYMLTFVGVMLTVGRVADILGRRRLYLAGFSVFSLGLLLCGLAWSLPLLLVGRVVQGLGGAMMISNSNAVIATAFSSSERGKALGLLEAVVGAGLMMGPSIGGVLLEYFSWPTLFTIQIPVGLFGLVLAWRVLRESPREAYSGGFDVAGAVTLFVGLVSLMLAINRGPSLGWSSPFVLGLAAAAVLTLAAFLIVERRAAQPVLDLSVFRYRPFAVNSGVLFLYFLPSVSMPFLIPFFLIQGAGYSPTEAGLFLIIIPSLMLMMSPITGTLSDKLGAQAMTVTGLGLMGFGLFMLHFVATDAARWDVAWRIVLAGMGAGFFLTPTYNAIMGSLPPERVGVASALIPTVRTVGLGTGIALAGAILEARRGVYVASLTGVSGEALANRALALGV